MLRVAMATMLAAATGLLAMAAPAQDSAPDLSALPPGPGRELVAAKCSACHPLAIVTGQKRDRMAWEQTIDQMIGRGAEIDDAQYEQIAAYLGRSFAP
jgi:mono/diheme cytochrome c family protein